MSVASDFAAVMGTPKFVSTFALRADVMCAAVDPAPFRLNNQHSAVTGGLFFHTAQFPFSKNSADNQTVSQRWSFNVVYPDPAAGNAFANPAGSLDGVGDLVLQAYNNFGGLPVDGNQQFPVPAAGVVGAGSSELFEVFRWTRAGVCVAPTAAPFQQFVVNGVNLAGIGNTMNLLPCYSGVLFNLDTVGTAAVTWTFVLPDITGAAALSYDFVVNSSTGAAPSNTLVLRFQHSGAGKPPLVGRTMFLQQATAAAGAVINAMTIAPQGTLGVGTPGTLGLPGAAGVTIGLTGVAGLLNGDTIRIKAMNAIAPATSCWNVEIITSHAIAAAASAYDGFATFSGAP